MEIMYVFLQHENQTARVQGPAVESVIRYFSQEEVLYIIDSSGESNWVRVGMANGSLVTFVFESPVSSEQFVRWYPGFARGLQPAVIYPFQ